MCGNFFVCDGTYSVSENTWLEMYDDDSGENMSCCNYISPNKWLYLQRNELLLVIF